MRPLSAASVRSLPRLATAIVFTTALVFASAGAAVAQGLTVVDSKDTSKQTPRFADGKPDFSGFWRGTRDTRPVGNIGKDLPGFKLPLTPEGEKALQHNLTK